MKSIKKLSNKDLKKEYESYSQMINDIGCFGIRDLIYFNNLEREIYERGMRIVTTSVVILQ